MSEDRTTAPPDDGLRRMLRPRSVAFVGASANPVKVGGRRWLSMLEAGFAGPVYPVHPSAAEVAGVPAVRSIAEIPGPLDLVVVAIRPDAAAEVVEACAARRVGGVVVITGGFGEQDEAGRALELRMRQRLAAAGARMIGPNCAGIFSAAGRVNVTGMVLPPGPIGLVTQSGNVLLDTAHRARRSGIGFSAAISVGNGVDLRPPELVQHLLADPATEVILVYAEGWQDGEARRFCEIARAARAAKPIILLKPGDTEAGRRAALSHTGAMAGEARVAEGAFAQAGILQARNLDEAWELAQALVGTPGLQSDAVCVASDGGGHATLGCDAVEEAGLTVPVFGEALRRSLLAVLPARCPVADPVDYAGYAEEVPAVVAETLDRCLADDAVGAALLAGHFGGYHRLAGPDVAAAEMAAAARLGRIARKRGKPIVVHSVYADDPEPAVAAMRHAGIPVVRTLPAAAALLAGLRRWGRIRGRGEAAGTAVAARAAGDPGTILRRAAADGLLLEPDARALLALYGLPVPESRVVRSPQEAVAAVSGLGGAAALKVVSARVVHKSDVGGVLLNVRPEGAAAAYERLAGVASRAGDPSAAVLVAAMVAGRGTELVLGGLRDRHFGPVVMVGLGGILVEALGDVTFATAPLDRDDALRMLGHLKHGALLDGYRGAGPVPRALVADALVRLGHLMAEQPSVREVDVNPLLCLDGRATILDARIVVGPA